MFTKVFIIVISPVELKLEKCGELANGSQDSSRHASSIVAVNGVLCVLTLQDWQRDVLIPLIQHAAGRNHAMTLRRHFHAYLDGIRREGRYRIFTDLERHA